MDNKIKLKRAFELKETRELNKCLVFELNELARKIDEANLNGKTNIEFDNSGFSEKLSELIFEKLESDYYGYVVRYSHDEKVFTIHWD